MTDGPQALEQLRSKRYGLVISDLDMEPMDGTSCCARSGRRRP